GVTGRSVVAEVIRPDARLFHLLKTEGKEVARRYWMANGGITRRTHLLHRLGAGLVDPLEADETIPLDEDDVLQVPVDSGHAGTRSDGSPGTALSEELKGLVSLAVSSGIEQGLARGLQEAMQVALTALRQNAAAQRSSNTVNNNNGGGHGQ
ncbi:pilus assembly protein, partial [Salmonella enterica]|nr:pilus assembly protein [Salmonella enterica]